MADCDTSLQCQGLVSVPLVVLSNQWSVNVPVKTVNDGPSAWTPAIHIVDLIEFVASGSAQPVLTIWVLNQQVEELTFSDTLPFK